jgi:hypothetical protein
MAGTAFGFYGYGGRVSEYGATRPNIVRPDRKHFHNTFSPFKDISTNLRLNVFLFKNLQAEIGEIVPHYQGPAADGSPGEGDCVGQAAAMGCDVLAATNIHMLKQAEQFVAKSSVEMLYAGSRIEIGQADDPDGTNRLQGRGGSHGEWVARFLKEYGVLHRLKYSDAANSIDLTGYHPDRSRKYRDTGVPDWLEHFAKQHPVKEYTNVHTGQEALDAVCAGQPVIMCSSYAFSDKRDQDGFAEMYRGRWRPQWWHAMILTGAILEGRKGGIIQNSHGKWNDGPRPYDMPEGSFAVTIDDLHAMVTDWYDCYAISSYTGHHARQMHHRLYW